MYVAIRRQIFSQAKPFPQLSEIYFTDYSILARISEYFFLAISEYFSPCYPYLSPPGVAILSAIKLILYLRLSESLSLTAIRILSQKAINIILLSSYSNLFDLALNLPLSSIRTSHPLYPNRSLPAIKIVLNLNITFAVQIFLPDSHPNLYCCFRILGPSAIRVSILEGPSVVNVQSRLCGWCLRVCT